MGAIKETQLKRQNYYSLKIQKQLVYILYNKENLRIQQFGSEHLCVYFFLIFTY